MVALQPLMERKQSIGDECRVQAHAAIPLICWTTVIDRGASGSGPAWPYRKWVVVAALPNPGSSSSPHRKTVIGDGRLEHHQGPQWRTVFAKARLMVIHQLFKIRPVEKAGFDEAALQQGLSQPLAERTAKPLAERHAEPVAGRFRRPAGERHPGLRRCLCGHGWHRRRGSRGGIRARPR